MFWVVNILNVDLLVPKIRTNHDRLFTKLVLLDAATWETRLQAHFTCTSAMKLHETTCTNSSDEWKYYLTDWFGLVPCSAHARSAASSIRYFDYRNPRTSIYSELAGSHDGRATRNRDTCKLIRHFLRLISFRAQISVIRVFGIVSGVRDNT